MTTASAGGNRQSANDLAGRSCVPCRGGVQPLQPAEIVALASQVSGWDVVNEHHLEKKFKLPDFRSALRFVNQVGEIAEAEGHHPNIMLAWGKVEITVWTHAAGGLTDNDFILAAKIDRL